MNNLAEAGWVVMITISIHLKLLKEKAQWVLEEIFWGASEIHRGEISPWHLFSVRERIYISFSKRGFRMCGIFFFQWKMFSKSSIFFLCPSARHSVSRKRLWIRSVGRTNVLSYETLGQIQYYSQIFNVLPWEAERWLLGNLLFCLLF